MKYQVEKYAQVIDEIIPLLIKHYHEIALNKDKVPFDPDYAKYQELEQNGILDICTARTDTDELVGYCITFTMPHLHYKSTITSSVDIFYVTPEYRGKMCGPRLIKFSEQALRELRGTHMLMHHVKIAHDFSPILERAGYQHAEKIYSKYIGQ